MAGAGRRTFVPGEVLTASNVNSYLMDQAVMVFDDATERDIALGTAVVSEGMVTYLGDVDALSFYDGTAWRTLGSVSGLPVVAGGTGGTTVAEAQDNLRVGLVNIVPPTVNFSGGTATANSLNEVVFTGVTSISLNNVFSSSYTNYKIIVSKGLIASSAGAELAFRLRDGGTNRTTLYYYNGVVQLGANAPAASQQSNTNRWPLSNLANVDYNFSSLEVQSPAIASARTTFSNTAYGASASTLVFTNAGQHDAAQSHDGFTLTPSAGNITGAVAVYGYNI